jgi:hypothetical protein
LRGGSPEPPRHLSLAGREGRRCRAAGQEARRAKAFLALAYESAETAMVVGVLQMRLLVREAQSLKDKRRVIKSLRERLRHEFNVSASEVDALDRVQTAVLGVAVVTNDGAFADAVLAKVVDFTRRHRGAELVHYETEIL